ncbi:MAG: hypothetical protein ACRDY6_14850 [Acidimicrobiia bacterium]
MTRGRQLAVAGPLVVILAVVVVTLIVVVGGADSPPSAATALARAQRFVEQADSVEYRGAQQLRFDAEGTGNETVERTTFHEAAVFPDRSHSLAVYEDSAFEAIAVDGLLYSRDAADRDALDDAPWEEAEGEAGFFVLPAPPQDLPDLLAGARRPRLVGHEDGITTLRVAVEEIEPDLVLAVADDGRLAALGYASDDEFGSEAVKIVFEHWNTNVDIVAPDDSDIDPTPLIDEDAVAAYDDAPLYQPRAIPEGWVLDSATVLPDFATTDEGAPCETVMVSFLDPDNGEGYLSLYQAPDECALPRPQRADDFAAGSNDGWIADELDFLEGTLVVDGTMLQFDTDLTPEALSVLFGDLVPLDLSNPPPATLELG